MEEYLVKRTLLPSLAFFLWVVILPGVVAGGPVLEEEGAEKPDANAASSPSGKDSDADILKFTEAIRRNPKDEKAYLHRGRAYGERAIRQGHRRPQRGYPAGPEGREAYRDRGRAYGAGDWRPRRLSEAIRLDPKDARLMAAAKAGPTGRKDNLNRALGDLNEAIRLDPKDALAHGSRGSIYEEKHELDKAIADCSEAVRLDPKNAQAYGARACAYAEKRRVGQGHRRLQRGHPTGPERRLGLRLPGVRLRESASGTRPLPTSTRSSGSIRRMHRPTTAAAGPTGKSASGTRPSLTTAKPSGWIQRTPGPTAAGGWAYEEKREFDKAIADLNEAIRLDPKDATVYGSRGWVYVEKRDFDRAVADYGEAIRLGPKDAAAYRGRGCVYRAEARVGQGHRRLQRGHSPQPEGRCGLQRPRVDLWRKAQVRQGHRRL